MAASATFDFAGKVILITGGGTGIGRGIAEAFAGAGAMAVVTGRRAEPLQSFCGAFPGRSDHIQMDVGIDEQRRRTIDDVIERHGRLDVLINNALAFAGGPLEAIPIEKAERMYRVLVLGTIGMTQAALPHLVASRGSVLNISSVVGRFVPNPPDSGAIYASAKAAVNQFSRTLAVELAPRGVRVNAIAPGVVATEASQDNQKLADMIAQMTPMGRMGRTSDISSVALFLSSDAAGWVTGQVVDAAGGWGITG